jgi:hypothetical protein
VSRATISPLSLALSPGAGARGQYEGLRRDHPFVSSSKSSTMLITVPLDSRV